MGIVTHRTLRRAMRADARRTQDLQTKRVVGAFGRYHLLVRETESCGGDRVVPNAGGATFGPNAQAIVTSIGGGRSRAVISRPPSGAGSRLPPNPVSKTVPVTQNAEADLTGSSIVLRATAWGSGSITFEIARFDGASYVETLHTGVTIDGWPTHTEAAARAALGVAKPLVGLSGVPDGSLYIPATNGITHPYASKLHIINISTGAVSSRLFVPTAIGSETTLDRIARGYAVIGGELYVYFSGPNGGSQWEFVQLAKFPGNMSTQTILNGHQDSGSGATFSGGVFFPSGLLYPNTFGSDVWHLMPYDGGAVTEDYVTGKPDPNAVDGVLPVSLGLAGGKYWTVGGGTAGVGSDINVFTVTSLAVAASSGWTNIGLPSSAVYEQELLYLADMYPTFSFNRDETEIVGSWLWQTTGAPWKTGLMRLPLTATAWGDATFVELETGTFQPDVALADLRDPATV